MSEPFVGQILAVGFNFAPAGWLMCDGSLVAISEYDVLFNLIGTTYGGNGQTTFSVPDLRGRAAVGMGQGSGQPNYIIGQAGGSESVTLLTTQIPAHTHTLNASGTPGSAATPSPNLFLSQNGESTSPVIFGPAADLI